MKPWKSRDIHIYFNYYSNVTNLLFTFTELYTLHSTRIIQLKINLFIYIYIHDCFCGSIQMCNEIKRYYAEKLT
jgi:hypothetical protein